MCTYCRRFSLEIHMSYLCIQPSWRGMDRNRRRSLDWGTSLRRLSDAAFRWQQGRRLHLQETERQSPCYWWCQWTWCCFHTHDRVCSYWQSLPVSHCNPVPIYKRKENKKTRIRSRKKSKMNLRDFLYNL